MAWSGRPHMFAYQLQRAHRCQCSECCSGRRRVPGIHVGARAGLVPRKSRRHTVGRHSYHGVHGVPLGVFHQRPPVFEPARLLAGAGAFGHHHCQHSARRPAAQGSASSGRLGTAQLRFASVGPTQCALHRPRIPSLLWRKMLVGEWTERKLPPKKHAAPRRLHLWRDRAVGHTVQVALPASGHLVQAVHPVIHGQRTPDAPCDHGSRGRHCLRGETSFVAADHPRLLCRHLPAVRDNQRVPQASALRFLVHRPGTPGSLRDHVSCTGRSLWPLDGRTMRTRCWIGPSKQETVDAAPPQ